MNEQLEQALQGWQKKLTALRVAEVTVTDAAVKFKLSQEIEECKEKIKEITEELYNQVAPSTDPLPPKPTPMNLQEFIKYGILNELATLFQTRDEANLLLDSIGFPIPNRPAFPTDGRTLGYWREVCNLIQSGILSTGNDLQILVNAAVTFFPNNNILKSYATK